jgi:hypothetical protein
MNRPLPLGDRGVGAATALRASRRSRTVPGSGRLVGGVAAAAGEPTTGPGRATFGPRSLRQREVVVSANAARRPGIGTNEKSPPAAGAGRARKEAPMLLADPVSSLAALRFEGLDSVSGVFHRAGHEAADGVFLPAHFLHDLGERGAVFPLEHSDDLGRFAAFAWPGGLFRLGGLFGLGRALRGSPVRFRPVNRAASARHLGGGHNIAEAADRTQHSSVRPRPGGRLDLQPCSQGDRDRGYRSALVEPGAGRGTVEVLREMK